MSKLVERAEALVLAFEADGTSLGSDPVAARQAAVAALVRLRSLSWELVTDEDIVEAFRRADADPASARRVIQTLRTRDDKGG